MWSLPDMIWAGVVAALVVGPIYYVLQWEGIVILSQRGIRWCVRRWRGLTTASLATVGMRLVTGKEILDFIIWAQGAAILIGILAEILQLGVPDEETRESPPAE